MNISKQTNLIVKQVLGPDNVIDIDKCKRQNIDINTVQNKDKTYITYVPHGIDKNVFKPVDKQDKAFIQFKQKVLKNKQYKYIVFYNNRNIRRKCTTNLMAAFKFFVDQLPESQKKKVLLYLHTTPSDMHGTNLIQCHKRILPQCQVIIQGSPYSPQQLNYLYNMASVTVGVSSAQGFGLATAESLMVGVPIIATVTGGLQDQMALRDNKQLYINSIQQPSKQDGLIEQYGK